MSFSGVIKNCKLYTRADKDKKPIAFFDIEAPSGLSNTSEFALGSQLSEGSIMTVLTKPTAFDMGIVSGNYNLEVPNFGDLKITGYNKIINNVGGLRPTFRYRLTLEG